MAALRKKKKLAALNKEDWEEHPRSNLAQTSNVPRSQEDYITQISEEIEGRVTKKLSQEFSRTANRILGALSRHGDFLMNPLIQDHSGTAPETSRNGYGTNQRTNEDDSPCDPHPDASLLQSQTTRNFGPGDGHDILLKTKNRRSKARKSPFWFKEDILWAIAWFKDSQHLDACW